MYEEFQKNRPGLANAENQKRGSRLEHQYGRLGVAIGQATGLTAEGS